MSAPRPTSPARPGACGARRAACAALLASLAPACAAPKPPLEDRGPEWLSVWVASVDRRGSDEDQVTDSAALAIEGGYDVLRTRRFDAGFELGVAWSRHDVEQVDGLDDDPQLDAGRWALGARAALDLAPLNVVLWANGGIYVRTESSGDEPGFEQEGRGSYVGGGIDFWFDETGRMGPFVRYYDLVDSDLTELLLGLSATFSI